MRIVFAIGLLLLSAFPGLLYGESSLPRLLATLELDRQEAFVKEQILVTLRLGYPKEAFGMSPSTLQVSNADLYPLDKTEWEESVDNLPYRMIETKYALFGNSMGAINLSATISSALLPVSSGGDNSTENPRILASVPAQTIAIKAAPAMSDKGGTTRWLAASMVSLSSHWETISGTLHPGTPLTRNIVVDVLGQHAAAVPQRVNLNLPDNVRGYPTQVVVSTKKTPEGLHGSVVLPVTLVASESGHYRLPEIIVPWWDINNKQWRDAILPAEILGVARLNSPGGIGNYKYISVALGLLAAVLGVCCAVLWRLRVKPYVNNSQVSSEKHAWQQLRISVKYGNPAELRGKLLLWLRVLYPEEINSGLETLLLRHPQAREMVGTLEQGLYGRQANAEIDRKQLMLTLLAVRRKGMIARKSQQPKNGLYPESISW